MRKILPSLICAMLAGFPGGGFAQGPDMLAQCRSLSSQLPKPENKNYAAHIRDHIERVALPACSRVVADKSASREERITALHRRANYFAQLGRFDRARGDVNDLLRLDRNRAETHVLRASLLKRQGRASEALRSLTGSIAALPQEHGLYMERGYMREAAKKFEQAAEDFSAAIKIGRNPVESAEAHMARGRVFSRTGKLPEAVEDYSAAIELDRRPEEQGFAYVNRAEAWLYLKEKEKAADDLRRMMQITTAAHPARNLANILLENAGRE